METFSPFVESYAVPMSNFSDLLLTTIGVPLVMHCARSNAGPWVCTILTAHNWLEGNCHNCCCSRLVVDGGGFALGA
jgi:hypothetical protein